MQVIQTRYLCDNCKRTLSNSSTLNDKETYSIPHIFIEGSLGLYKVDPCNEIKKLQANGTNKWNNGVYHFCNIKCLSEFMFKELPTELGSKCFEKQEVFNISIDKDEMQKRIKEGIAAEKKIWGTSKKDRGLPQTLNKED